MAFVTLGFRNRTSLVVVLALAASLTMGLAPGGHLHAQELPAAVASDLVDEALQQELDAPVVAGGAPLRSRVSSAMAWFSMLLAIMVLIMGRNRVERMPVAVAIGSSRYRYLTKPDRRRSQQEDPDPAPSAAARPRAPAPPREALVLPPHVAAILARSAAGGAAAASAPDDGREAPSDAATPATPDPTPGGLDLLVPGYDPWSGR